MPELVELFFDGRAEVTTAIDLVFADGGSAVAPNREVAEVELARLLPMIGVALQSIRWLCGTGWSPQRAASRSCGSASAGATAKSRCSMVGSSGQR